MASIALRPPWPLPSDGVVTLRLWSPDDLDQLVAACQDLEIPRWTLMPDPYARADGKQFLRESPDQWRLGVGAPFCMCSADDPMRVLGAIGLFPQHAGIAGVGYWVAREARRRGVASRALRLLAAWAFESVHVARLELTVIPGNEASMRVAQSAGFQREGLLRSFIDQRGTRRDAWMFSRLPGDLVPDHGDLRDPSEI